MDNLDSDIILLQLWKGERQPQNEEEIKWKQELDAIKQRGEIPDISWFE